MPPSSPLVPPPRGRGASWNPQNRFERLRLEPDLADLEAAGDLELSAPGTTYFRDRSQSVVARNDSPDVGFDAGINPYRGCSHGCVYCLHPETPILYADMIWRPIGEARRGDLLVGFDEYPQPGRTRKLRAAMVQKVWWSKRPSVRLVTRDREVITTADHRWLQARSFRWSRTSQLRPGRLLRRMPIAHSGAFDADYRAGYVAGMMVGDGTFRYETGWRSNRLGFPTAYWRVALTEREPLERLVGYLGSFGVGTAIRRFDGGPGSRRSLQRVEVRSLASLEKLQTLVRAERSTASFRRGFLAGFFDAEGYNGDVLRVSQVDLSVLGRVQDYASGFGFSFQLERPESRVSTLRLVGSLVERIRFFGVCQPAIRRKLHAVFGREMNLQSEPVEALAPGGIADVVDIQTTTGTFFAAGLATHNCFARPSHEYLGLSAGLDFETKILVKEDAPELLRRELSSPRWTPQVVALSGNTDPYQPIERRLRITRRCLEVLAELRNPVAVITKNHLVTRDADLLRELASVNAAAVRISVTTLHPELARTMEPRTSTPARRLAAIEALAGAGVPVGVLVAPVIPGLTDHELPSILRAARDAGALFAGWTLLRLPHAVAPLFERWLDEHRPERKGKVLGRIRELRGGRLSDPRFGSRQRGEGPLAGTLDALFSATCRQVGLSETGPPLSTAAFRGCAGQEHGSREQLPLFG